jgi:hypothetical protein
MLRPMNANKLSSRWPLILIGLPCMVATWAGWVQLGEMCGFGLVEPFPGITDFTIDTRITLPLGTEAYAIYAMEKATHRETPARARRWAGWSSAFSFGVGLAAQVTFHLLESAGVTKAPWPVVVLVSVVLVGVLGSAALLFHLLGDVDVVAGPVAVEAAPAPVEAHEDPREEATPIEAPEEPPAPVEAVTEPQAIEAPVAELDDDERAEILDRWIAGDLPVGDAVALLRVSRSRAFALRNRRRDGAI